MLLLKWAYLDMNYLQSCQLLIVFSRAAHFITPWYLIKIYNHMILIFVSYYIILCMLLLQLFYSTLSRTIWVSQYQKKHSPTHTYPDHQSTFISFLRLQRSVAPSLFSLHASQFFCTSSLQVLFGLPLGLARPLYSAYYSLPSHCLLFTTRAHTITF